MPESLDAAMAHAGSRLDWADIRFLSRRLLDCARGRDWKAAAEFRERRDRMIRGFFETPVAAFEVESVRRGILEILESDRKCMALIGEEKKRTGAKIYEIRSGRRAREAYADARDGTG